MKRNPLAFIIPIFLLSVPLGGCGTKKPAEPKEYYRVAPRQLPPEPVYTRLRWVHLPETHPVRDVSLLPGHSEDRPKLMQIVHFTVKDSSLCDAAVVLAGLARYETYCSSRLKEKRITLDALGTLDELAALIEAQNDIHIVVDHVNKEVRFLASTPIEESFYDEDVANEH